MSSLAGALDLPSDTQFSRLQQDVDMHDADTDPNEAKTNEDDDDMGDDLFGGDDGQVEYVKHAAYVFLLCALLEE